MKNKKFIFIVVLLILTGIVTMVVTQTVINDPKEEDLTQLEDELNKNEDNKSEEKNEEDNKVEENKKEDNMKNEENNNKQEEIKNETNNKDESTITTTITSKGYTLTNNNGLYTIDGIVISNKTYSLPKNYGNGLTSELNEAFNSMKNDALKDNISIKIISGFRSYNTQVSTYNYWVSQYGKKEADRISARAGHSEHQTGLAIDINSLEKAFKNTKEGKWLNENAYKYGFILRYPESKEEITGYSFEPWHFRYVGTDLSYKLYNNGDWITIEEYYGITSSYE